MADKDTSTEDSVDTSDESVETDTTVTEDEELDTENQDDAEDDTESNDEDSEDSDDDDASEDDSDEDDSDDDSEEEDKEESEFTKAFTQIKGDNIEEYKENLEEAYRVSSREGKRLSIELKDSQNRLDKIASVVAKNPELAKLISDETLEGEANPTVDPALLKARQDMEENMTKDYNAFVESHPELDTDEELQAELLENLQVIGERSRKQGKIPKMSDALKKAWAMMDREDDPAEVLSRKAKENASKPKASVAKKKKPEGKPKLTPEQIKIGKKLGLTEKQLLDTL